jgi:hypothetical protein
VTIRPAPHTMTYVTALLPVANGVGVYAALNYAAIAFGVLAMLVAILADPLGIGGNEGFGWKQGFPLSVGVSVALGGVGVMRGWFAGLRRKRGRRPPRRAAVAHRSPARPAATSLTPGRHKFTKPPT